jgi:cobalt-zinc-cadmium efflux system membrane fusion protein
MLTALSVLTVAGIALGVARVRPELIPEWARVGPLRGRVVDAGPLCPEHGVPEKLCTLCHPELKGTLRLCREHGDIPERLCTLCHPEAARTYGLSLCEHRLPKNLCPTCAAEHQDARLIDDGWCALHNQPEETCSECEAGHPKQPAADAQATCSSPLPLVRFASTEVAETVGIETADVREERHAHFLKANAETAYDANRYANISPRVAGYLREARADLGQAVAAGEVLAVVDSAEVSAAKSQYLSSQAALSLARDNYERTSALAKQNALPLKDEVAASAAFNQAQATAQDAQQKLRNLGFNDDDLAETRKAKDNSSRLKIVSPLAGTVVVRHAGLGEAVEAASKLFAVADTAKLWLWIDVYESDIASVALGQPVSFTISGTDGPTFKGQVTWAGTEVNQTTRTIRIRAEVGNPGGRLRANQFGRVEIRVGDEHRAVVVPKGAVQRKDRVDVVFLPLGDGRYRPQRVVTRPSGHKDCVEVVWGLKPGQKVVTTGAFLLKTEITRGAIGAGCAD